MASYKVLCKALQYSVLFNVWGKECQSGLLVGGFEQDLDSPSSFPARTKYGLPNAAYTQEFELIWALRGQNWSIKNNIDWPWI